MFATSTNLSSAQGILALLEDPDPTLKTYALQRLDQMVPTYWPEISEKIDQVQILYENEKFNNRNLAALLVSKLYFQLGDYDESLNYALSAEQEFDINEASEFVETIALKCIDTYTETRQEMEFDENVKCDERMVKLVERMLYQALNENKLKETIGIAIETRRYDILEEAIKGNNCTQMDEMIGYVAKLCLTVVEETSLRRKILLLLVKISKEVEKPNFINVCNCLVHLNDSNMVAEILNSLVCSSDNSNKLVGYQIAFDLYENSTQGFIKRIIKQLNKTETTQLKQTDSDVVQSSSKPTEPSPTEKITQTLIKILSGDLTIDLHLQFLIRNNNADLQILQQTKGYVTKSITHNATLIANSLMYAGTTSDKFLRDNLEWLSKSTNWSKFIATSSLGVIHKGHEKDALKRMSVYLPKDSGNATSPYQNGGGLYALGLIHSNHGNPEIIKYIRDELDKSKAEAAKHGALLGLGLVCMGTHDMVIYEQIREHLRCDDAIVGEAAGIAMGLLMAGSNNKDVLEEMINYSRETHHEKIVRGLSLGISLILYGQLNAASDTIKELLNDKEFLLRRAGCLATGLAWVGSGHNDALSKMLHIAVSDVSDDVRRASVQAIGFILSRNPDNCPHVVELLSHSYNPHVRCGAATALGIACAATGNKEALTLLEPMCSDPVNYVRQYATMASAMILMQHTEYSSKDRSKKFRDIYKKMIQDKSEDIMGKFGAILSQGIIDAGGRNSSIHIADQKTGHVHMPSVIGLACFLNSWYWFPMSHFLSLAFRPCSLIMLNVNLDLPKIDVKCNVKPSAFAYPEKLTTSKDEKKEKVKTAILSVTAKAKRNEKKDDKDEKDQKDMDTKEEKIAEKETKPKKKKEQNFSMLPNPFRALPMQLKYLSIQPDCKYTSIKSIQEGGIILVNNSKPDEKEDLVERVAAGGPKVNEKDENKDEAKMPNAFVWKDEYDRDDSLDESVKDGDEEEKVDENVAKNSESKTDLSIGKFDKKSEDNKGEKNDDMDDEEKK